MSLQSKNMTSIWIKKAIVLEQLNIYLRNSEFNKIPEIFMPSIYNMLGICSKGWKTANDTKYCIYRACINKITIFFQVTDGSDSANELLNTCDDLTNNLNSTARWMYIQFKADGATNVQGLSATVKPMYTGWCPFTTYSCTLGD